MQHFVDGNATSGYFTGGGKLGKIWLKLKCLHANHATLSEAFWDVRNLQNPSVLKRLDTKRDMNKEDKLIDLTTSLSYESPRHCTSTGTTFEIYGKMHHIHLKKTLLFGYNAYHQHTSLASPTLSYL